MRMDLLTHRDLVKDSLIRRASLMHSLEMHSLEMHSLEIVSVTKLKELCINGDPNIMNGIVVD